MNEKIYEIIEGITLSKFKVTDDDVILLTIDRDIFDVDETQAIFEAVTRTLPKNTILVKFKGIEIDRLKEKTLDEIK